MTATIQTALGPVPAAALGVTFMHEHVINVNPGIWRSWPELLGGRDAFLDRATAKLRALKEEGGVQTIVDLSSFDIGRDGELLKAVAARAGVNIIASTGHHQMFTLTTRGLSTEQFEHWFTREIEVGVDGTDCRAGVIKVASDKGGVTPEEERVLRAAGRVSVRTGTPIYAHSFAPGRVGLQQLDILSAEGVPAANVCIGHSDDLAHLAYTVELARRGCWIGLDRYPGGPLHHGETEADWKERAELLARLAAEGFAGQLLLSHDSSIGLTMPSPAAVRRYFADHHDGMLFIHRHVIPHLIRLGVAESEIGKILTDNPRRFLTCAR